MWSDFKNNTKRKGARINRAACSTDGGPASKLELSDLELRVLSLTGSQPARSRPNIQERRRSAQREHLDTASEQFVNSDTEWRNLATEFVTENSRLRERELRQQDRWQTLFDRFLDIMVQFIPRDRGED